ncbi:AraC family transcriptional regulator [Brevibacillus humidisoli]|uniref:helix-turn-helix transcriptional regulator n=1 Tax=Brevibacillus humidisoli TaxID=2895522 RepID=UPI001E5C5A9D|nr:AraC family transcriptional regulator [Brevibacillus humidisoli]UFJ42463.1 AraC family transcriptional regulator [Brevibacillus humidisoli]
MIVLWEYRETAGRASDQAPLAESVDPAVPVVSVDSYQAMIQAMEAAPCEALIIICEQEKLPERYDLTRLIGQVPIYVFVNVGVAEKLILHYLLFYLSTRADAGHAANHLGELPPPVSDGGGGSIDWRQSIRYIHSNMTRNDLSLEEVASQNYVCKWHFSKLFKQQFGITFREYLISARLERAKQMLRSNQSVTDVCYAVGYGDLAHFIRIFRKKVGMTPSDYKRQHRIDSTKGVSK